MNLPRVFTAVTSSSFGCSWPHWAPTAEMSTRPPPCDLCVGAPSACATLTKRASCSSADGCAWYGQLKRTLGLRLTMQSKGGFGNYWPFIRLLHLLAASLGRRLLLSASFRLPHRQFAIGGMQPWILQDHAAERAHHRRHPVLILHEEALTVSSSARLPPTASRRERWEADLGVRPALVQTLTAPSVASAHHVWLNITTWHVQALLAAGASYGNPSFYLPACAFQARDAWTAACLDRLVTTPRAGSALAAAHAALRRRLPRGDYFGVHVRTMASDMRIPANWSEPLRGVAVDTRGTLTLLAYDMGVNVSEYVASVRALCKRGTLYVASDSRAVPRALAELCPSHRVLSGGQSRNDHTNLDDLAGESGNGQTAYNIHGGGGGNRALAAPSRAASAVSDLDNLDGPMLDWLALAEAGKGCGRWAHDSTFQATAIARGRFCAGGMVGLLPKPWARRRRIHTHTLWANLRRAARCYASDPPETCAAAGGRVQRAVLQHRAGFPGTPCEGLTSVLACARLIYAGLLSTT